MENNLPEGWDTPLMGEVVSIKSGNSKLTKKKYSPDGEYIAFSGSGPDGKTKFYEHEGEAIILSAVGARCGKCFRAKGKWTAIANTSIIRSKIDNHDVYRYLFYMFNNENFWPKGGTGQPFVKSGVATKEMRIPFPPISEQKLIADKLDVVLAKLKDCQTRLEKIPLILNRFRESVLTVACSGKLTELRNEYPLVQFGELIKSIRGGTTAVPTSDVTKYPVLRSNSVRQGAIDLENVKYLNKEQSLNPDNFISNGDLLFTRLNGTAEYVGNCALVSAVEPNKYQYPDRLYCARVVDKLLPAYCVLVFSLPKIRNDIENRAKSSAGHKRISISDIKEIYIPLPTVLEQQEIIYRVEVLFSLVNKIEDYYNKAKVQVGKLEQSILTKAFRGELVSLKGRVV